MSTIFDLPIYNSTMADRLGSTIGKANSPKTVRTKKGFAMDCKASEYIYSSTVLGTFNTICLEFFLDEEVTSTSGANYLGSTSGAGVYVFGSYSANWTNETFGWFDTADTNGGYIRTNIPKGHNQIILVWNGSYYNCWLNGVQVTTYTNGGDQFTDRSVYLGKQAIAGNYFTGKIRYCKISDHSYTNTEISQQYKKFELGAWSCPPVRGFNNYPFENSCFQGDGVGNSINLIPLSLTSGIDNWELECNVSEPTLSGFRVLLNAYVGGNNGFYIGYVNGDVYFKYGDGINTAALTGVVTGGNHNIKAGISGNSMYLNVDGTIYAADISAIVKADFPLKYIGYLIATGTYIDYNFWNFDFKQSGASLVNYPCNEATYDFPTFYDASGNGNYGTASGTNYRTTCDDNNYNRDNGCTKVTYQGNTVLVPNLSTKQELYSSAAPVLNANEKAKTYGEFSKLYLHEQFKDNPIDVVCNPKGTIVKSGTFKIIEESVSEKRIECVTNGSFNINLVTIDNSKTIKMTYDIGGGDVDYEDTIANANTDLAWFSYSGKIGTFTLTSGNQIGAIIIKD